MFVTLSQLIEMFEDMTERIVDLEGMVQIFASYHLDSICACKILSGKLFTLLSILGIWVGQDLQREIVWYGAYCFEKCEFPNIINSSKWLGVEIYNVM